MMSPIRSSTALKAGMLRRIIWPIGSRITSPRIFTRIGRGYVLINSIVRTGGRTDANPLALRWVDPAQPIFDCLPPEPELPPLGQVLGGDWDIDTPRFEDRPIPISIRAHFRDGKPWEETPLRGHIEDQISQFGHAWGYREQAFERRCEAIESLYERMNTEGYRTQSDLAMDGRTGPGPPAVPLFGEITVDIGRNGAVCWRGNGQHRLAIARLLGIEQVPVLVARRHTEWQRLRDVVRQQGIDAVEPALQHHPDLADIVQ